MSAPGVLDAIAIDRGFLGRRTPPEELPAQKFLTMRSKDPVAVLSREYDDLCVNAVDGMEIATGLEAAGFTDPIVSTRFGVPTVFDLGEKIFAMVPRRPVTPDPTPDPWALPPRRVAARGVVYAIPAVLYAAAVASIPVEGVAALMVGTLICAALGQTVALLGFILRGRGDQVAATQLMRGALVVCVVGALVTTAVGWSVDALGLAVLLGMQLLYVLASTVLLVYAEEGLLIAWLAPSLLVAVAALGGLIPSQVTNTLLALGVCAVLKVAWSSTAPAPSAAGCGVPGRGLVRVLGWRELRTAAVVGGYGAMVCLLFGFGSMDAWASGRGGQAGSAAASMIPVILCLGWSEWLVFRLRSQGRAITFTLATLGSVRTWIARAVVTSLCWNAGVVAACAVPVVAWQVSRGADLVEVAVLTSAYLALGLVFLLGSLLLSVSAGQDALRLTAPAFIADMLARFVLIHEGVTSVGGLPALGLAHLVIFTVLLVLTLRLAIARLAVLSVHR